MPKLPFDTLNSLTGGRLGIFDVPCPLCSPFHNPRRKVLRIWRDEDGFARFHCVRCAETGFARDGDQRTGLRPSPETIARLKHEARIREATEAARQLKKAQWLANSSLSAPGSIVERYLREGRKFSGQIPPTLRFLPAHKPEHHPAMIAVFGIPQEVAPGVLGPLANDRVTGVHLTLLQPDGTAKAGTGRDKIIVGHSTGSPIVIAPPNDLLGLVVTEGIEDALSVHEATGLGAWAAGSAGRMPALAPVIPDYLDTVTVVVDADPAGRKNTYAFASALRRRGLHVEMLTLNAAHEIAA